MAPRRGDSAVADFLTSHIEASEIETISMLDGVEAVSEDVASAINDLVQSTDVDGITQRRKKKRMMVMYDRYDRPRKISSDRIIMTLREKDQQGNPYFYARPRGVSMQLVKVQCPDCGKWITENPDLRTPSEPKNDQERQWREDTLLFPHVFKRHTPSVPQIFPDKERREELRTYTTGAGR